MQTLERWTFRLTLGMFFLTAIAVLIAVGYATVHLAGNMVTKDDLAASEARIISAIREDIQEAKDEVHNLRSETNNKVLNHVTTLHAKNQ